jgi:hypothetical protein
MEISGQGIVDEIHIIEPTIGYGGKYSYCEKILQTMCLTVGTDKMEMVPYVYDNGIAYQFVNEHMKEDATCGICIERYYTKKRNHIMRTLLEEMNESTND